MAKRKTAGELSLKALSDNSKYDPLEIGYALCDDVVKQLYICGERHKKVFDEDEYCLTLNIAGDPLIQGIRRHKYAAWLYLPSPRPEQSCYLFNKRSDKIKRLWTLPNAASMSIISEMAMVDHKWKQTKGWCDAFFDKRFWQYIRTEHNISMLSELEYLQTYREELIQAGCKEVKSVPTDSFDFSKISAYQVVDSDNAIA